MGGQTSSSPRTLLYDLETAPIIGTTWNLRETDVLWTVQDWYILCFAYKWLGERQTRVIALPDFPLYKREPSNDREVLRVLHALFDEADIVIAHNGDRFDQRKSNARFIYHGFAMPSPYKSIDTLKVARKHFAFSSSRLNDLGAHLGVGRKLKTTQDDWRGCMAGDPKAWRRMTRYNKQDVVLLEKVYLKLRGWITNHPNVALIAGRPESCPVCGQAGLMWAQGWRYTKTGKYRRFQCKNCGSYVSDRAAEKTDRPKYVS